MLPFLVDLVAVFECYLISIRVTYFLGFFAEQPCHSMSVPFRAGLQHSHPTTGIFFCFNLSIVGSFFFLFLALGDYLVS